MYIVLGLLLIFLIAVIVARFKSRKNNSSELSTYYDIEIKLNTDEAKSSIEPIKYDSLNDWKAGLVEIWSGRPHLIQFTYKKFNGEKTRRKVAVSKVLKDNKGSIYLFGECFLRNDFRHFNIDNITSKIFESSKRWEVIDWLMSKLGIDDL